MKTTLSRALCALAAAALLATGGCAGVSITQVMSYPVIKPEYPMPFVGDSMYSVTVDSLTPTLRWKAKSGVDKYDVAVWESPSQLAGMTITGSSIEELGDQVFFSQGIDGQSVTVTPELKPDKLYFWSVRPARTRVWSTYKSHELDFSTVEGLHFKFCTPKAVAQAK
jgi:hypothetical protein